jgi:uncharacterized coiled-coil protein SlyX
MSHARTPIAPDPSQIQDQLQQLAAAAQTLNELSDQLTKHVGDIETSLNKLNIGITANVKTEQWSDDEEGLSSTIWRLGYEKTSKQWGFVIERITEDCRYPEAGTYESWAFKDAPREHRLLSVEKIPALLNALLEKSKDVASDISGKVSYAKSLATSLAMSKADGSKK